MVFEKSVIIQMKINNENESHILLQSTVDQQLFNKSTILFIGTLVNT